MKALSQKVRTNRFDREKPDRDRCDTNRFDREKLGTNCINMFDRESIDII